jgi:hypothetical protein
MRYLKDGLLVLKSLEDIGVNIEHIMMGQRSVVHELESVYTSNNINLISIIRLSGNS